MAPIRCRHPKCLNTHKNVSGYCAEHIEQHVRHQQHLHEGRACSDPHLVEEYSNINLLKVI